MGAERCAVGKGAASRFGEGERETDLRERRGEHPGNGFRWL